MFFEKKYYLEKKEQDCTNFVLKALPQYLALKERKRLKDEIIEIKLLAQLNDDIIPNFENADYIYRNIMYIEIIVNNINRVQSYIEILHKLFKAPTILKISDTKQNYLYSFSVKRLNKLDNENIVIEHIINTTQFNDIIYIRKKSEYEEIINKAVNKNNKFEYYFELLFRSKIFSLKNELKQEYNELLESKMFYDYEKMLYNFDKLLILEDLIQKYDKENSMAEKIKIRKELDNIIFIC